jgi:hypothetical protein
MPMSEQPVVYDLGADGPTLRVPSGKSPAPHRITIKMPMGSKPRLTCWCGGSIPLDYGHDEGGVTAMTARMQAFLDAHEGCERPSEGT